MRNIFHRSSEFVAKHKHHHHFFLAVFALIVAGTGAYTFRHEIVQAATYTIFQTSWGGTVGGGTVTHSPDGNNQTSWDGYSSASTTISIGDNDVSLLSASYSFTDDGSTTPVSPDSSGGGFASGTYSATVSTTTASGVSVGLVPRVSASYAAGTQPWGGVAFDSSTNSVWVSSGGSTNVKKYTASTGVLVGTYTVGAGPRGVAFDSSTNSIWVANSNSATVTKITASTGAVVGSYTTGASTNPFGITFDSSTNSIWTANGSAGTVTKLNASTGALVGTYTPEGTFPWGIAFDSFTNSVWVSNSGTANVTKLSATDGAVIGTYNVGGTPYSITFDPSTNSIWAANYNGSSVTKLTASTGALVGTYTTGSRPWSITFDSNTNSIWTANDNAGTITKLTASTGALVGNYTIGSRPSGIAFDSSTNSVWVGLYGTNSVVKYPNSVYSTPGTFTSNTIDFARPTIFTSLSFASTTPASAETSCTISSGSGCAIKIQIATSSSSGGPWNFKGPDGDPSTYFTSNTGGNIITTNGFNGGRYFKYQATLSTANTTVTPTLDSVIINDTQYSADGGALISSKYDSGDATNQVSKVTWAGSATSTSETIKFQVRTASSAGGLDSATWCGYADTGTCTGSNYFEYTHSGVSITDTSHPLRSGENDEFVQYRVVFASGGAISPILDDVTVQYVVNAAPVITITTSTVSQASDGTVTVVYTLEDSDTVSSGSYAGKADITLQYCTSNCNTGNEVWAGAVTVSGDVGAGVTLGANKTVVWTNPYTDYPSNYKANTQKIRIKAYDGEGANHTGYSSASNTFILDTALPVISSAVIDSSAGASTGSGNTAGTITLTITDDSTKQYRLCNNIAFPDNDAQGNTCTWTTPLASTISGDVVSSWVFTGNSTAETVYMQARDFYSNTTATRTITAPAMPTSLVVADVSNPNANSFGETLSWVADPSFTTGWSYDVDYATSVTEGGPAGSYTWKASPTTNIYPHSITTATTSAYWYRVRAVNANGDKSNFVTVTGGDIPNGFGTSLPDAAAPAILSSSVPTIKNTSANIIFETDELAIGQVYWGEGTTANAGTCTTATTPTTTYATSTSVWLNGLLSERDYVYCFKVTDVLGNPSAVLSGGTFTTVGGPVITNVTEREITDTSAVIFWNTSTSSTSWVKYATSASGVTNGTSVGSDTMVSESPTPGVIQHQVGLGVATPLVAGQTYYFQVTSTNSDGTTTDTNNGQYYKFVTLLDTSPPTITGTSTPVLASNAAVVVWQTDEPADGQLFFDTSDHGTDTSLYPKYTQSQTPATSIKSIFHVMTLSSDYTNYGSGGGNLGLVKETPYYYVVKSSDTAGNIAKSAGTFTTPSDGNVTITVVAVSVAAPAGTTPDTTAPAVSNVKISDITPFSAVVKFDTDEDADGFAEYGKDVKYGDTAGDKTFAKTHTIKLRGLTLGTDYHIKVTAHDKAGNTGTSADQTFKTTFLSENLKDMANVENIEQFQKEIESAIESILPSLVPPFIAKPIISDITESGVTVSFKTNIKAFPVVVFAEDGAYEETKENPYTGEVSDTAEKATTHSLKLTGLKGNTKYHVQARGFSLPKVIGKSADVTFITKASKIAGSIVERKKDSFTVVWTTEQPTSSIVEYKDLKRGITGRKTDDAKKKSHSMKIENLPPGTAYEVNLSGLTEQGNVAEAGSPLSVTTSTDTTPPIISGFKVDNALVPGRTDRIQTIVSWVTDEPSTSTAFYEEGAGAPGDTEELASKNEILDSYVTNHSVILPSLKPGTIYRLKVTSSDDSGNLGSFGPRTVITPKQTESITDIIFKNFEDSFKFLQKI